MVTSKEIIERAIEAEDPAGAFLNHHGVKGMKWGVRKRRTSAGPATSGPSKPNVKQLSDADLKAAINRMNLEQQYKSLSKPKKTETQVFVKQLGKTAVNTAFGAAVTWQVGRTLKKFG